MTKNIVIFSDGTGQEGGKKHNTNIYKTFNIVENRTPRQITFYDRGLGTGWRKISGNVSGKGISKNIQECYRFIFDNFVAGDRIYLFGFSRGATTVRSLSSFIHYFGILPKSRPELIEKAYDIYMISDETERKQKADEFIKKHHTMWVKVHFIGCYDTVAALGLPIKALSVFINQFKYMRHKFHNLTLSESVEHAYHALAIDDERLTFHPELWDNKTKNNKTIKQVWFCGMHTDVGGGYKEHDLSDISFIWMNKQAENHGLLFHKKYTENININPNGFMHNSRGTFLTRLFRRKQRTWEPSKIESKPTLHYSVLERLKNIDNETTPAYKPWITQLPCGYDIEQ